MGKLLNFVLGILLLPLIYAVSYEALLFFIQIEWKDTLFFLLGMAVYVLLYAVALTGKIGFLETLEHELTHAGASLAMFKMPKKLVVDPKGGGKTAGETETEAAGCFLVALAPYFLPLFTLPLLLLRPVVPPPFDRVIDSLIGFTLAFHYVRLYNDLRVKQSDIVDTGIIFSVIFSVVMNLVFLLVILAVVIGQYSMIPEYFGASWERAKMAYQTIIQAIRSVDLGYGFVLKFGSASLFTKMIFRIEVKTMVKIAPRNSDQSISRFVVWKNGLRRKPSARPRNIIGARVQ